jgi:V/A-type H+-transporting ATPase subunit E
MGTQESNDAVGVQELIDRLKSEGVQEGQEQANALLTEAKKQAASIIDSARAEADGILRDAVKEAEQIEINGKRALKLAARDTGLQLKEQLEHEFRGWLCALVQSELGRPSILPQLLREMAGQCSQTIQESDATGELVILAPETQEAQNKSVEELNAFVENEAATMFRQGVSVQFDPSVQHGFRMRLVEKNIEIDMTDEAVTAALMRFLAPKFRKLIGSS